MNKLYKINVRKLSTVLGVLGITAIVFSACENQGKTSSTVAIDGETSAVDISDLKIAYIHTDSVINNYTYFIERSADIAEKGKRFEGELSSRAKGFEQEVANFQESASNMTMNQARAKEEELVTKERNLVSYRDNLMKELSADENTLYNEVYDKIQEYLKEYAKENDLEMILSYTRGGGVWYANEALDITKSVSEGINNDYSSKITPEKEDSVTNN
ncbi:MAG: OmpH family outer membrane protein [Anditalea sp.]